MIIAVTGHRPEKIPNPNYVQVALSEAYLNLGVTKVIQGMAAGVDLWSAREAFLLSIPFVAVRPWAGHKPRRIDEFSYEMALKHAVEVVDTNDSEEYIGPWLYQKRNEWMVDRADAVLAVWDGSKKGGTYNCVKYAEKKNATIFRIDPTTETLSQYA